MFDSTKLTAMDEEWTRRFEEHNRAMRLKTGAASTNNPLIVFLYLLMRDCLPAGVVEQKASEATIACDRLEGGVRDGLREDHIIFTNGWLSSHAADLAARLTTDMRPGDKT